jgi:hypothetical protein
MISDTRRDQSSRRSQPGQQKSGRQAFGEDIYRFVEPDDHHQRFERTAQQRIDGFCGHLAQARARVLHPRQRKQRGFRRGEKGAHCKQRNDH